MTSSLHQQLIIIMNEWPTSEQVDVFPYLKKPGATMMSHGQGIITKQHVASYKFNLTLN